jgi:thymidine phosphorylase
VGLAAVELGAGRQRKEDKVDPAVGFVFHKKVGDRVELKEPLVQVHYNDEAKAERVKERLLAAVRLGPTPPPARPLILERLA